MMVPYDSFSLNNRRQEAYVFRSAVRPLTPIPRDAISVYGGGILTKLGTNIHHVNGHCWQGLNGQGSKVKL